MTFLLLAPIPTTADGEPGPFFLMGSGRLHLKNLRNGREAGVELLNPDGSLNDAALNEVDRVFGFPTTAKGEHISPRLLGMVSYFADRMAPGATINIESAYRSPEYNDGIRKRGANAARTSTHMDGMALDFWLEGVDGKKLWQTIREQDCCGVGHYGGKTIHLDAGRPRFWEAATSGTKTVEPDHNRHLYLSTEYDRYRPGGRLRLSLSGLSTFGFGVRPMAVVESEKSGEQAPLALDLPAPTGSDCILLQDRKATRFLYATLPATLPAGRYRIGLDFCNRPFPQMPATARSNVIEIGGQTPR
ncbi:DUF882 domain-containing protein [Desulfoprunum benzoelyticum]|nr:DUF882 domain-containing protein [Desulfoprunum benzoelyticum]MBM9529966.1 DUF882 domain-containing protein [Desulfoprunum benzoelyticum]